MPISDKARGGCVVEGPVLAYEPLCDTGQVISSIVFGPNISRRLGTVLGVNVLPPGKAACTYRCLYCPLLPFLELVGRADEVQGWPSPASVAEALRGALDRLRPYHELDALVLIGNGEPTLHPELAEVVQEALRAREELVPGAEVVVFTNSSLLWDEGIVRALSGADRVVAKLDAVDVELWKAINRPSDALPGLKEVLRGLKELRKATSSSGSKLIVSVTLLELPGGLGNASEKHLRALSSFLSDLGPDQVHLETPLAPPEPGARPLTREELAEATLFVSDLLGAERVFALLGTTVPISAGLLRASRGVRGAARLRARLPEEAMALLTYGPGARTRVRILEVLAVRKMNCNQIARALGMSWWSVQRHLGRLLEAGLVKAIPFGRRTIYAITQAGLYALTALKRGPEGPGLPARFL